MKTHISWRKGTVWISGSSELELINEFSVQITPIKDARVHALLGSSWARVPSWSSVSG